MRRSLLVLLTAIVVSVLVWLIASPAATNCWMLITGRGFFIPDESSVFSFRPTEMNSGSGEWWLYGEDSNFLYAYGQTDGARYHAFPKLNLVDCPDMDPLVFETWCERFIQTKASIEAQQGEALNP